MLERNNLDWKTYESITKYIYEELGKKAGVQVLGYGKDCKIRGKSDVIHQIDILTSHSDGIHTYKTAIECKYWKEKVTKDTVMKVSEIIEDAGISKGVIVSKNGFTEDGAAFAKHKNIGIVELREVDEINKDVGQREIEIGQVEISTRIRINRPEIISTLIEYVAKDSKIDAVNIYNIFVRMPDGSQKPFTDFTRAFQDELHKQKKFNEYLTKRYEIPGGQLITNHQPAAEITGLAFTGILRQIHSNHNRSFSLVENVWLMMKSIFEEKTFIISENGIIIEHTKSS